MCKVMISHPGLQHSHQFALALHEVGLLGRFISGVPVKAKDKEWSFLPTSVLSKIKCVDIPKELRSHPLYWQLLLRTGGRFGSPGYKQDFMHRLFHWFDDWVSKEIDKYNPDVVVCFENSAASTFKAAKKIGAKCILDAPSIHYQEGKKLISYRTNGYSKEIEERKDKEIELADAVITCSKYGADTYLSAGVSSEKLYPILLGADLPKDINQNNKVEEEGIRFVFAGTMRSCKSVDLMLAAFNRLYREGISVEFKIIGGSESNGWIEQVKQVPNAEYLGAVGQRELFDHFVQSDCLLLPSRFDSFGMVVAEAMAVGIPAIVSTNTGAKEMIEKFPGSGWVINATEQDIYDSIKKVIVGDWNVKQASKHALQASQYFTWQSYRKRVVEVVQSVINDS